LPGLRLLGWSHPSSISISRGTFQPVRRTAANGLNCLTPGGGSGKPREYKKTPQAACSGLRLGRSLCSFKPWSGLHLDARGVGPRKGQYKQQSEMQLHDVILLDYLLAPVKGHIEAIGESDALRFARRIPT
jgi:hypothetical protein